MPVRDHGYYGYAFVGCRLVTIIALVAIIGLVSNFISIINKSKHASPGELTGTLVVVSLPIDTLSLELSSVLTPTLDVHRIPLERPVLHCL